MAYGRARLTCAVNLYIAYHTCIWRVFGIMLALGYVWCSVHMSFVLPMCRRKVLERSHTLHCNRTDLHRQAVLCAQTGEGQAEQSTITGQVTELQAAPFLTHP